MNNLKKLIELCKCSVTVQVNNHRDVHETVDEYIDGFENLVTVDDETRKKMIEKDTVVHVQFYPRTPIGSTSILHYDLDLALQEAVDDLTKGKDNGKEKEKPS